MKTKLIFTILLFVSCYKSFATQQTFIKSLSFDTLTVTPIGTCKSTNGNYFSYGIIGTYQYLFYVIKFNPQHDTLWTLAIDSLDNLSTPGNLTGTYDGGCAIRNNKGNRLVVLRLDSAGNLVYKRNYGPIIPQPLGDIIETRDSDLLVIYMDEQIAIPSYYFGQLIKLDRNGDTLWTRIILPMDYEFGVKLFENNLGEIYVLSGDHILKMDSLGNSIWNTSQVLPGQPGFNLHGLIGFGNDKLAVWDDNWQASLGDSATLYLLDSSGTCYNACRFVSQKIIDVVYTYDGNLAVLLNSIVTDSLSILGLDTNLQTRFCKKYFSVSGARSKARILQLNDSALFTCGTRHDTISNVAMPFMMLSGEYGENACIDDSINLNPTSVTDLFVAVPDQPPGTLTHLADFSFNSNFTSYQGIVTVPVCISLGIDQLTSDYLSIGPNPCGGSLHIISETEIRKIIVTTVIGKVEREMNSNHIYETDLNLSNLSDGIYLVSIINERGLRITRKIILQH